MKRWLENARTAARLGIARVMADRALRACRARPVILAYHRVSAQRRASLHDEPGMAVTLDTFEAHMDFLRKNFAPVALREITEAVARGMTLPGRSFAVTFDDAWADSANALPILRQWGIPATVFASASHIGTEREFWTSRLLRILSSARNGCSPPLKTWPRAAAKAAVARLGSKRLDRNPALSWLASLPAETREYALDQFAERCGVAVHRPSVDFMTVEDLRVWLSAGMEVGSHGHDHGCLTNSNRSIVEHEVAQSKQFLQEVLGAEISGFAYPYGEVNEPVRSAVVRAGYEYACALERPRGERPDVFALPRRPVHEGVSADLGGRFSADLFICYLAGVFDWRRQ